MAGIHIQRRAWHWTSSIRPIVSNGFKVSDHDGVRNLSLMVTDRQTTTVLHVGQAVRRRHPHRTILFGWKALDTTIRRNHSATSVAEKLRHHAGRQAVP